MELKSTVPRRGHHGCGHYSYRVIFRGDCCNYRFDLLHRLLKVSKEAVCPDSGTKKN